jgi:hypothetical protein
MATLGNDEMIIKEESFNSDVAVFWIRSNYTLTNKRIIGSVPNINFRFIPMGKNELSIPLKSISSVGISSKFQLKRLINGLIFLVIGGFLSILVIGIPIFLVGLVDVISPYHTSFSIVNNAGQRMEYKISNLQKNKAQDYVTQINIAIANTL